MENYYEKIKEISVVDEKRGISFETSFIVTNFEPISIKKYKGANDKIRFLNFIIEESSISDDIYCYFNSKLNQDESYERSLYKEVYNFNMEDLDEEFYLNCGESRFYLPYMFDNIKHYVIEIINSDGLSKYYKLFNSYIVEYDLECHQESAKKWKSSRSSKKSKLDKLMKENDMSFEDLEALIKSASK